MAGNGRDLLKDAEVMAIAFPIFAVGAVIVTAAAVVAFVQTGIIGMAHSALGLIATAGLFGAVAPAGSRVRKPALVVGIVTSATGVALGSYLLTFGQPVTEVSPTWLTTALCAFWLGSFWMLAVTRFR
jgi:hypothetical protein